MGYRSDRGKILVNYTMKIYFISGLAADRRVFKYIQLPKGFEAVHLDWIDPKKNESLEAYAWRLAEKIDTKEEFILLGLSMGGMIAAEIAKKYKPAGTILLSSVSTYKQFPSRFKIAYYLRLHKIVPAQFFKSASVLKRLFATSETPADKLLIQEIIRESDTEFIRWALGAILQWKNEEAPSPLWHIHGSKDEILPMKKTSPTHIIPKGTHLMVISRAGELNKLLEEVLVSFTKLHGLPQRGNDVIED